MKQASFQERLDFYLYKSAHHYLTQAHAILNHVVRLNRDETPDWMIESFWTSFYIIYGKRFKQSRFSKDVSVALPKEGLIPEKFIGTHDAIIQIRDKMFAHTDFQSFSDDLGAPMNGLILRIENRKLRFGASLVTLREQGVEKYNLLLCHLTKTLKYRSEKIWNRWARNVPMSYYADWLLNLSNEKDVDDVFIRLKHERRPGTSVRFGK